MLENLFAIIGLIVAPTVVSIICWWLLGKPLRQVVGYLCNDPRPGVKEVSGIFWQRLYLSLTIFIPILCVLLFLPDLSQGLDKILLYSLRLSVFGGVLLLLVLAILVQQQIRILQRHPLLIPPSEDNPVHSAASIWANGKKR